MTAVELFSSTQILGLDHYGARNGRETREVVLAHMRALRKVECASNARIIFIAEDNMDESQNTAEVVLREIDGVDVLCRAENRYGVRTDANTKPAYVFRFADLLVHGGVRYHEPLVSANPFVTNRTATERRIEARTELERQLRSFQRIRDLAPGLTAVKKIFYTGKADNEKKNTSRLKDDMVLALLLGVYWAGEFKNGAIDTRGYASQFQRANDHPHTRVPLISPIIADQNPVITMQSRLDGSAYKKSRPSQV